MKRLIIWLALLLPFIANAQVNGTIQKTASSGVVRGNFGSGGADTIVTVRGVSVNGQLLQYNSTYKKWIPYTPSAIGSTGIISGGTMTGVGSANLIVSSGTGTVLDNTTPASPSFYNVSWVTDTIGLTDNSTNYIYVTSGGVIMATTVTPTPQDYRTRIYLGRAQKISGAITSINGDYVPVQQSPANIDDMFKAYGLAKTGLAVNPDSINLKIDVASGDIFGFGINFSNNVLSPNNISYSAVSKQTFRMVTSGDISTTNVTDLPVGFYNPSGTTVSAIGGGANESSIFTVYKFPTTGNVRILYGNTTYASLSAAVTAIGAYTPTPPAVFRDAIIIGYIAAVKTATDLSNTAQAVFVTTNKFGLAGGSLASSALTNYVLKSGDTMTGTLNGTDIVLSDNIKATGLNSTGQATLGSLNQGGKMNFVSGGTGAVGGTLGFSTNATTNILSLQNIQGLELTSTNSNGYVAVRATGANGSINFRTGSNINGYVHPSGNWSFQNGGTYTDNGYRIDVNGTGRFTSTLTANSFVKSGGTSSQFLKGDGSVDANTYLTTTGSGSGLSGVMLLTGNQTATGIKTISDAISFPTTTGSGVGVIQKGTSRFIHNFELAGTDGLNTFVGVNSGNFTMTGSTSSQGSRNVGLGGNTLQSNTTGQLNTAVGFASLSTNTTGIANTGIGVNALSSSTTGTSNTAIGGYALSNVTTGSNNLAIGYLSGNLITTGSGNTIIGANVAGSTTITDNIIIANGNGTIKAQHDATNWALTGGVSATGSISSTPQGTLYGTASGSITSAQLATSLTDETGTGNAVFSASPTFTGTLIGTDGNFSGSLGIGISPTFPFHVSKSLSNNYVAQLTNTNTTAGTSFGLFINAGTNGSDRAININNAANTLTLLTSYGNGDFEIGGSNATKASGTAWINPSDLRLKKNIGEYSKGLKEVLQIKPKTWYFNEASGFDKTKKHLSPIAQELQQIMPEMVSTYKGKLNGKEQELLQVDASDMTWLLVKAIQEQQAIIEKLNLRITVLEQK